MLQRRLDADIKSIPGQRARSAKIDACLTFSCATPFGAVMKISAFDQFDFSSSKHAGIYDPPDTSTVNARWGRSSSAGSVRAIFDPKRPIAA